MSSDKKYSEIKKPKLYCGDKYPTPDGYDGVDSKYGCLKKGIGVGIGIQKRKEKESGVQDGDIVKVNYDEMVSMAQTLGLDVPVGEDIATILNRIEKQLKKISIN